MITGSSLKEPETAEDTNDSWALAMTDAVEKDDAVGDSGRTGAAAAVDWVDVVGVGSGACWYVGAGR